VPAVAAYTGLIAVPVVVATGGIAVVADPLISFLFGERWAPASHFVVALAIWASVRLVAMPITSLVVVLRLQKTTLAIDAVFAWRLLVIPAFAALGRTALEAVVAFVALSVLYHLVSALVGLAFARTRDQALVRERLPA
jgi:O-antigen/teichoic acid export membrane protein